MRASVANMVGALRRCTRFVEAAAATVEASHRLGTEQLVLLLHSDGAPPALIVGNGSHATDWERHVQTLRERFAPHVTAADLNYLAVPMLGASGWFATAVFGDPKPCSRELERELTMMVAELSAWCVAHGVDAVPRIEPGLTPRGFEIGQLVREGMTNAEIAGELGISINTVKLRLKQAFERLAIDTREELAVIMRRLAPLEGVPLGVSERGGVKITRAAHTAAWVPAYSASA